MLTVMCPNCRHRFPATGCCEPRTTQQNKDDNFEETSPAYYGGMLVPRGYTSGGGCVINAPTIIHGPAIIQSDGRHCGSVTRILSSSSETTMDSSRGVTCDSDKSMRNAVCNSERPPKSPRSDHAHDRTRMQAEDHRSPSICRITTTCDLTGGSVTISTPGIQSGGCLIQSTDSCILVQTPHVEIRPKLSGGGCLVQKKMSTDDQDGIVDSTGMEEQMNDTRCAFSNLEDIYSNRMTLIPPSGCQELPGIRRNPPSAKVCSEKRPIDDDFDRPRYNFCENDSGFSSIKVTHKQDSRMHDRIHCKEEQLPRQQTPRHTFQDPVFSPRPQSTCCMERKSECAHNDLPNLCQGNATPANNNNNNNGLQFNPSTGDFSKNGNDQESLLLHPANGVQIQVNATVQLPANLGQCFVNITATRTNSNCPERSTGTTTASCNNFNGGGIVETEDCRTSSNESTMSNNCDNNGSTYNNVERRDETPTTPVSWVMPLPWGFDSYLMDKDRAKLLETKKLLQTCGWYHEGLSWQQSENLLKNAAIGRWLMRDSSDSRYTFAVSVQTERGPTSVRVHYFLGRFRLDAEPRFALAMPLFDCPIKMLEHYVEYSKRMDEHRMEVWVDYSGQLYSQIYLTKPLVKEVRSLSHLARLTVNRNKLPTEHLPSIIKNYLAEYPYTL
ncbi:hypothetical protein KPH14_005108 [Odynerus spinipes]|uniref:SH2 domain-containing protein n=1 Tax=Odynerus spinipes TaxID=1348599 RepID=A0AAD9VNS2_9HYME|nr:hypothetical protein KPH14_005108 [Odynerus spinipes]